MNKQLSERAQKTKRDAALRRQAKEELARIKRKNYWIYEGSHDEYIAKKLFDLMEQAGLELPL